MSWQRISCSEADRILASRRHVVLAGRTDTDSGESYRKWGTEDGTPVLREYLDRVGPYCIHEVPTIEVEL